MSEEYEIDPLRDLVLKATEMQKTIGKQMDLITDLRRQLASAQARIEKLEAALPTSFYAGLPPLERTTRMVEHWRRLVNVNHELEEQVNGLDAAMRKARELLTGPSAEIAPKLITEAWLILDAALAPKEAPRWMGPAEYTARKEAGDLPPEGTYYTGEYRESK